METKMYRRMYAILCCAASEAIDALELPGNVERAKEILQQALWEAEDIYVMGEEESL